MKIVKALEEDASQIAAIIRESHQDVARMFAITEENNPKHPSFCATDWVLKDFRRGEEYFLCKIGDTVAGCVAFEQPDAQTAYLNRLSVLPGYRHQGLGAALVRHILAYARSRPVSIVSIGIIASHEGLKTWYAGLGFVEKDTRTFAHLPFDVTFMQYGI
jgi:ribosomal protein S18 acetylase RimI-like enzyme